MSAMPDSISPADGHALQLLLESISKENAVARDLVGQLLFEKFSKAKHASTRRICAVEIFCKLMEIIEDFGAFCLMWIKAPADGDRLRVYLSVSTTDILAFYAECLGGLSREKLMAIVPFEKPEVLASEGLFSSDRERAAYQVMFDKEIAMWDQNLSMSAKLYSRLGEESGKPRHADVLNMFFNAKHGRKVLHPKGKLADKFGLKEEEVAIIGPNHGAKAGEGHWLIMHFSIAPESVKKQLRDTGIIAKQLSELARARLTLLEEPQSFRSEVRKLLPTLVAMAEKTIAPDASCPCGNGKKFGECHGR